MLAFFVLLEIVLLAPSYESVVPMAVGFALMILVAAVSSPYGSTAVQRMIRSALLPYIGRGKGCISQEIRTELEILNGVCT